MTLSDQTLEFNFDGLVGPTHNYAGLAPGNLASQSSASDTSNPRAAAHQGLAKMQRLRALGVPQAVLPPHPRPNIDLLRQIVVVNHVQRKAEVSEFERTSSLHPGRAC